MGHLLTWLLIAFNEQDCAQVGELVQVIQQVTGSSVDVAFINQGYTHGAPEQGAKQ